MSVKDYFQIYVVKKLHEAETFLRS